MRWVRCALAALLLAIGAIVVVAGSATAADVDITYENNAWSPNPATAYVGDAIYFCNESGEDISVVIESFTVGPIEPETCEGNLIVEESDAETGSLSYHCVSPCSATGIIMVQQAPTTTMGPATTAAPTTAPPAPTATTRQATATTARRATATTRRATATTLDVTTTSEDTTTTFFDTTTTEFTTTTFGGFAINEDDGDRAGGNGAAVAVFLAIAAIGGGGGYLLWRNRFRYR